MHLLFVFANVVFSLTKGNNSALNVYMNSVSSPNTDSESVINKRAESGVSRKRNPRIQLSAGFPASCATAIPYFHVLFSCRYTEKKLTRH